jgi:ABC-type transporter lipoprotein component MlaA
LLQGNNARLSTADYYFTCAIMIGSRSKDDLPTEAIEGIATREIVNDTSFKIRDYESFKEAAVDPYRAIRDAFVQHWKKKVENNESMSEER